MPHPFGNPEVRRLDTERLHFFVREAPSLFHPIVLTSKECDGRREVGFELLQKIHGGILGVTRAKRRIEQKVGRNGGVVPFRVVGVIQARGGCRQQTDMPAGGAPACDNFPRIYAKFFRILLVPTNGTLRVGQTRFRDSVLLASSVPAFGASL